ncbi:hypothetical protein AB0L70_14940 [Kribbella sp. NPDC051952]|uniref:hypothetical protein n=1 Tax=Kribbella sp. NPDC051952 TaxID=3154851 RepID=UPI00342D694F
MNLQDLRDELATRAASADEHPADLLPGVRQKIRRTKQRRVVTAAGLTAAAVALAVTVVPGAITNSAPDPAEPTPYTQNGFSLPGELDGEPLLKGWAGRVGESHVEFDWTPASHEIAFSSRCRTESEAMIWVRINGVTVETSPCTPQGSLTMHGPASVRGLLTEVPVGRPAKVTVDLVDSAGHVVPDARQQVGVGIYADGGRAGTLPWGPSQPDDYERGGLRFRQQVGPQSRLAAVIGDPGAAQVATSFVATSRSVVVQTAGTTESYVFNPPEYRIQVLISDGTSVNGYPANGDQSLLDTSQPIQLSGPVGKRVQVTARLVDKFGKPQSVPGARIGVAIYDAGPQVTANGIDFDQEKEVDGVRYRFDRSVVVPAAQGKVQLTTPVGKPFLWAYGNTNLGPGVRTRWTGLTADQDGPPSSSGFGWTTEEAQSTAKTVSYHVSAGHPTGGKLAIALYLPVS